MGKRLALCVGLNYPKTSAELRGCVNDAHDWRDELQKRGYEVRVLLEPTKAELMAELRGMLARARFGYRTVFTYSGHGTWVPDKDGDEADGRDEALVCADYQRGGILTDDELQQIFTEVHYGVRRTILSDSCHSGSVSRFMSFSGKAAPASPKQARFLPPLMFTDGAELKRFEAVEKSTLHSPSRPGAALISGCNDHEFSYDASFNGRPNGAFTRAALDALPHTYTLKDWHTKIRERLPSVHYPQTPQLTATATQKRWQAL